MRGRGVQIFNFFTTCSFHLKYHFSYSVVSLDVLDIKLLQPSIGTSCYFLLYSGKQQLFSQIFIQVFKNLETLFVCFKLLSNQNKNISSLDSQPTSILIITQRYFYQIINTAYTLEEIIFLKKENQRKLTCFSLEENQRYKTEGRFGPFLYKMEEKKHNKSQVQFLSFIDYLMIACRSPQKNIKYFIHLVHPKFQGVIEINNPLVVDKHLAGSQLLCKPIIHTIFRSKIIFSY